MSLPSKRARQVGDLIKHELANLLKKSVFDPRLKDFSLTDVLMSPDLKHAKVYYSVVSLDELSAVKAALCKAARYLRHQLAQQVNLRYIPELKFIYDESIVRGEAIESLIDRVISDDSKDQSKKDEPDRE